MVRSMVWLGLLACGNEQGFTARADLGTDLEPDGRDATTRGTRFGVAFMENLTLDFNGPPEHEIVIEAEAETTGVIRVPATGFEIPFTVPAGVDGIRLPDALWYPEGPTIAATGIEVMTADPVHVVAYHHRLFFSEASRILPFEELGGDYRVLAVQDDIEVGPSAFAVQSLVDGTLVTIRPSTFTLDLRPAGEPYTVTLDQGEVLQVQAQGDLTGTRVTANERIAVFGGGREPTVECAAASHAWDQLPPVSRWGTDYVAAPLLEQSFGFVKVVAAEDGTGVTVDCEEAATLDAGDSAMVRVEGPARIRASAPVLAALVLPGGACASTQFLGDANLAVLTPVPLTRGGVQASRAADDTFVEGGGLRFDRVMAVLPEGATLSGAESPVADTPLDDGRLTTVDVTQPVNLSADALQGLAYGVSAHNAYTYNLGYDCISCAQDLQLPTDCAD